MSTIPQWSRRHLLLAGGKVLGGAVAAGTLWKPLIAAARPDQAAVAAGPHWLVVESREMPVPPWMAHHRGPEVQLLTLGERDLYAWWRELQRTAEGLQRALPQVHGLTRWAACSVMQMCAREAGLYVAVVAGEALPDGLVAWQVG